MKIKFYSAINRYKKYSRRNWCL